MASIYLGIDAGTSSTKCLAVDEQGQAVALAQQRYALSHPREGWAEQDAEEFWTALGHVIRQCVKECESKGHGAADVVSMAMSTQGDTLIVTDSAGDPVAPAHSWMDSRGSEEYRELLSEADMQFWYRETGIMLTPFSSACNIRWIERNLPDAYARIARICYVPDFLAMRLCGRFATDVPSASWSPMFRPSDRSWSQGVIDILGISRELLPEAVESGTVIGELLPDVAASLGLSPRVTLVAGAFDQAAAAKGAGATVNGRGTLSCGTAWVLYMVSPEPIQDPTCRLPICCHTSPNEWGLVLPFSGGAAYDWLNRTFAESDTRTSSDAEPPVFVPHLYGGVCPDWKEESKGSLLGLTMAHTAHDIRLAMMRGIASEARRNVEAAEEIGSRVGSVRMVGGAGKSEIWPQMIANVLNMPVEVTDLVESACYGAAKLAAGSASDQWAATETVRQYDPVPRQVDWEDRQFARFKRFYEALLPQYEADAGTGPG